MSILYSNPGILQKKTSTRFSTNCLKTGRPRSRHSLKAFACWETAGRRHRITSRIFWRATTFRIKWLDIETAASDSEVRSLVELWDDEETRSLPVVILPNGVRLRQPSLADLAERRLSS